VKYLDYQLMNKGKKNKLVPLLRFSEFRTAEEWEETTLENIAVYENGKAHENDISDTGKFIIVNSKFISTDGKVRKFTNSGFCLADKGTILMVLSDVPNGKAIAKCFYVDKNNTYTVNQRICKITPKKVVGSLLYYILNRNAYFLAFDDGVKQTNLKNEDVLNCPIIISKDPKEQQKIGDCLSSLDELITAQGQKLQALKTHKKGLVQQLFPIQDKITPTIRFAEFEYSGVWEEKTMEDAAIFLKGKGISKSDISPTGKQPCIRYGELYTHYTEIINSVVSFTNIDTDDLILSEAYDVIIPSSGETREDIATASCVLREGIALGGDLNIIRSEINGSFLAYYLSHSKKSSIVRLAQGNAVVHLYNSELKKIKINFPKSKEEQQKIADCFSSLDELIIIQTEKINALKTHKKGLMQQLFPNINTIS
jgi:type I restriction enzyme, S subunit